MSKVAPPHLKMRMAKPEIANCVALLEQQIASALVPNEQKLGLALARANLFGNYAMVCMYEKLVGFEEEDAAEATGKLLS